MMLRVFIYIFLVADLFSYSGYIDNTKKLELESILQLENKFEEFPQDRNSFGYGEFNVWIKKELMNDSLEKKEFILKFNPFYLQNLTLYEENTKEIDSFLHHTYLVTLEAKEKKTVYLKVDSPTNKTVILKSSQGLKGFLDVYDYENLLKYFFLATVIVLVIFNTFIYIFFRDKSYLIYIFYLTSLFIYQISALGIYNPFPNDFYKLLYFVSFGVNGTVLTMVYFVVNVTNLKKHSKLLYQIFLVVSFAIVINYLFIVFGNYTNAASFRATYLIPFTMFFVLMILIKTFKREPIVKYIFVGWLFVTGGLVMRVLTYSGILENTFLTNNSFVIGLILEALLFSIALAYRFNIIQQEQIQLLKEKQESDKLLFAQSKFAIAGQMLVGIEHQWKKPLNYISSVTMGLKDKLFFKENISEDELSNSIKKIEDSLVEMSSTMGDFRNMYASSKEKERFNIKETIERSINYFQSASKEIPIEIDSELEEIEIVGYENDFKHILLNLFQNSLDACIERKIEHLIINVKVKIVESYLTITIEDNGGGVKDPSKIFEAFYSTKKDMNTGVGLFIVKQIINDSLNGEIVANNTNNGLLIEIKVKL